MLGKISLTGILLAFSGILLVAFGAFPFGAESAEYATGSTTMNVTVRGYVSIAVSTCLSNGIGFATQDPNTNDNNATCNNVTANGGTGYNITVDQSSTVNINFTHASNRTNLTDGTNTLNIVNVTYNSNATANDGANLLNATSSEPLNTSWIGMETCGTLGDGANCWATYFLDVPASTPPGVYVTGYCWCGRQQATDEGNCGTCT